MENLKTNFKDTYLWALSLSINCTEVTRKVQYSLYNKNHSISAIALPPLIPLYFSNLTSHFESLKVDFSFEETTFDLIAKVDNSLFLKTSNQEFNEKYSLLKKLIKTAPVDKKPLFPHDGGIYLGSYSADFICNPITNDDWRLILLKVSYLEEKEKVDNIRVSLLKSRHLV